MKKLMTRQFEKWILKQNITSEALNKALDEIILGNYEASLGGHIYKKRIRFENTGKSGSGRTIVCFKKGSYAVYMYGFSKNEKDNLTKSELIALKALAKILLDMTEEQVSIAVDAGKLKEL